MIETLVVAVKLHPIEIGSVDLAVRHRVEKTPTFVEQMPVLRTAAAALQDSTGGLEDAIEPAVFVELVETAGEALLSDGVASQMLADLQLASQVSRSNWNDPFSPSGAIYNAAPFHPHLEDPS
jgi:hypothetical protein